MLASDRSVTTYRLLFPPQVRWGLSAAEPTYLGAVSLGVFVYLGHGDVGVEFIPVFLYKDRTKRGGILT